MSASTVQQGEILGIIGPNGAGKSTVMELISGTQRPDKGSVMFRGREIAGRAAHVISRMGVARTFQKLRPFLGMTVIENVMVSALVHESRMVRAREIALECIEFVGLTAKRDAMSNTLSTGQRKRLELARVMAKRPAALSARRGDGGRGSAQHRRPGRADRAAARQGRHGRHHRAQYDGDPPAVRSAGRAATGAQDRRRTAGRVLADETVVRAYVGA